MDLILLILEFIVEEVSGL